MDSKQIKKESSIKQTSPSSLTKFEIQRCNKILHHLEKNPNASCFLEPVNWKKLKLLDYPEIIKKPMDLSTVKKKLKANSYSSFDAFDRDLQLIWDNCRTYNVEDSEIYIAANEMERYTRKLIQSTNKIQTEQRQPLTPESMSDKTPVEDNANGMVVDDVREQTTTVTSVASVTSVTNVPTIVAPEDEHLSIEEKKRFADMMRGMSDIKITQLIKWLIEKKSDILEDNDSDKIRLRVDLMDKSTYRSLCEQFNL